MRLTDANGGDVVRTTLELRLMIAYRDAWGCRWREPDGTWSNGHIFVPLDARIDEIVEKQPVRQRSTRDENVDPLLGTHGQFKLENQ